MCVRRVSAGPLDVHTTAQYGVAQDHALASPPPSECQKFIPMGSVPRGASLLPFPSPSLRISLGSTATENKAVIANHSTSFRMSATG